MEFFRLVLGKVTEETPKFETLRSLPNGAELRRYAPYLVAQVEWTPRADDADTRAPFMALAKYIGVFGEAQNKRAGGGGEAHKLPMTAPVLMGEAPPSPEKLPMAAPVLIGDALGELSPTKRFMRFVLPSALTLETAPTPTNPEVQLVEVPAKLVAALRFSGRMGVGRVDAHGGKLVEALAADGALTPASGKAKPWYYGGFNPPFTLPFLRTNEVYVDVVETAAPAGNTAAARA